MNNPHAKDAEAAGRYCAEFVTAKKRWARNADLGYIYWLARWAGHWGNLAVDVASRRIVVSA